MCGIFCSILYNQSVFLNQMAKKGTFKESNPQFADCIESVVQRGPDCYNEIRKDVSSCTILQCAASVLWMQGPNPVPQPLIDEDENILLWNGDILNGTLVSDGNDTKVLSEKLLDACRKSLEIPEIFTQIRGPYSFIFYHSKTKKLYFGRDIIGRHSLLVRFSQRNVTLSSVANRKLDEFIEVPAVGIFEFSLEKDGEIRSALYPWSHLPNEVLSDTKFLPRPLMDKFEIRESLKTYMLVPTRRNKFPTRDELEMWATTDSNLSVSQLMDKLSTSSSKVRTENVMTLLSAKPSVQVLVEDLLNTLREAVRVRIQKCPKLCKACTEIFVKKGEFNDCHHSKLAILFSGGLDSSVLAALSNSFVPIDEPIDLLNVAFEKITDNTSSKSQGSRNSHKVRENAPVYKVPDRITGLDSLAELNELFPKRKWNFVKIDVPLEELRRERDRVIADLIYPLNTILDESLGCALWFASRGKGVLHATNESYTSPARILLSGIGADEQLGGYMRHRTTLRNKGGWEALDNELQMELRRISRRNLGRDNRVVGSHGKQCRMPFLDEDVINYLNFIPPWYKCYPVESMPPGLGDKLLLRLTAWALGLRNASNIPKRAMQFGSRIANGRENGSDISERLT